MLNKRIVFIVFLFFAVLWTLSLASADDLGVDVVNATDDEISVDLSDDIVDSNSNDVLEIEDSSVDDVLESSKKGTFTELQDKINNAKKGSTIYLTKDYQYDNVFGSRNGMKIAKSLTIDGKGHKIDGRYNSALFLISNADNVVLKNIVFQNGYIRGSAAVGVICILNSNNVKFDNCMFIDNCADEFNYYTVGDFYEYCDSHNLDYDTEYYGYGGAVYLNNCQNPSFTGCQFNANSATYGGAVYLDCCNRASFSGCEFKWNSATYGGALYFDCCQDSSFSCCNFYLNRGENGGTVYLGYSSSSFVGCNFNAYGIDYGYEEDEDYYEYSHVDYGTIYSFHAVLNILNSNFINGRADVAGGDIYSQQSMVFLTNSSFSNSNSEGQGGSLSFDNDYVQISGCTFKECLSEGYGGGAIYCSNSIFGCSYSRFENCSAGYGGAVCSLNSDLTIQNCTFDNSYASNYGGSIFSRFGSVSVDGSVFSYSFGWNGGAMYIGSPYRIGSITNNLFLYCSARNDGYRIWVDGYYDEIPEIGNIYEDVYFVYGEFETYGTDDEKCHNYSNVITYVFSNADGFQNDLPFYDDLTQAFISKIDYENSNSSFTIFDEDYPNNSTVFLKYFNYSGSGLSYDAGYFYNECNSSNLNIRICNFNGISLDNLQSMGYDDNEMFGGRMVYFSPYYDGFSIVPISDDEKDIIVFDEYDGNQYLWISPTTFEEFNSYRIKGKLYFNFTDKKLYYNHGNSYVYSFEYSLVPLLNPDYGACPSSYEESWLSPTSSVKNQYNGGNCWAFAGITTLESCLKKITGMEYDFSVNNVKNLMASSSIYGLNLDVNGGGYDSMLMSYLASWLGPINDEKDKYNPSSSLSMREEEMFHIQDITFLSPRKNGGDNDEFKYAIMNYGAVAVTFNWTTNEYAGLHSVSIVGWDDNYNDFDCLGNYAKGAWIFKNSWGAWGESFGYDVDDQKAGYGYLSYDEKISAELSPYLHAYTFVFNDGNVGYQDIYQYDFAGFTDFLCTEDEFVYYKNRFVATDNEYLLAFSTYFERPTYFTFSVRINGKDITMTEDNIPIDESIHYSSAGYHTIPLGYNLTLNKDDEFEIIIKLVNNDVNYVPISQSDELYKLTYPNNVSFISFNGEDWFDMYDLDFTNTFAYGGNKSNTCQVACIKAFTSSCKSGSMAGYLSFTGNHVLASFYNSYSLVEGVVEGGYVDYDAKYWDWIYDDGLYLVIPGWDESYERFECYIELNVTNKGETVYLKMNKYGRIYLNLNKFHISNYCSAQFKSNFFSSDVIHFDFIYYDDGEVYAPLSELAKIIDDAEEGSEIILGRDYCFDIDSNSNESYILINKSLTLDGAGHILNGQYRTGLLKISSGCCVTLKNMEFKMGYCGDFGAIASYGNLTVINCSFINNYANAGGGAIFADEFSNLRVVNSSFTNNGAARHGGTIFSRNILNVTGSSFKFNEMEYKLIYRNYYYDDKGRLCSSPVYVQLTSPEVIYFSRYADAYGDLYLKNNEFTVKTKNVVDIFYDVDEIPYKLPLNLLFSKASAVKGDYINLCQIMDDDGSTFRLKDVDVIISNQNTRLTLKAEFNPSFGGYVFKTSGLNYGTYKLTGSVSGNYASDCTVVDGILYVVKKSVISASTLTKVYGNNKKLTVTLIDDKGKAISNVYLSVKLNGKTFKIKTNSKGRASLAVKLAPKTYKATVTFAGNTKYYKASRNVKVVIKKATPKIVAKKKTFKKALKTKKYTIVLKDNLGKAIKNAKVSIKVGKKTYTAKTNNKGKATFKIKKLTKKGTYKATVTYKGNAYYNKVTKKVNIKVK